VTAKNIIIMEQESLPPLEEIDDDGYGPSFGKISTHSTAMVSTDDEFDVAALDDDIEVAAEQVVDEWSDRLKRSDVFGASEEQQQQDEDLYGGGAAEDMVVGTMNETLPAGGYDEVVMGYDGENADEDDDNDRSSNELEGAEQQGGEDDEEEDVFEEEEELVDETGSFSEEIIDDTEVMMDDGEIQEILDQYDDEAGEDGAVVSPAVESEEAEEANDEEDESVASQASGAFEHRNELLSVPPEAPQRQRSDGQEKYEKNASVEGTGKGMQDSEDDHETDLDGSVDTSVAEDVVNVHETKQYARPEAPVGFAGRTHDSEEEESGEEAAELGRTKEYINNVTDDLETGKTMAADTPVPAQTDKRTNANGDDDVDDDDDGFLICILVVACLCAVLIVLAIVLPLVFLRKRGPGPTLAPSQSPVMAPSSMVNSD
jgi:hypothetical protein